QFHVPDRERRKQHQPGHGSFPRSDLLVADDIGRNPRRKAGNPHRLSQRRPQAMQFWDGVKPREAIAREQQRPNELTGEDFMNEPIRQTGKVELGRSTEPFQNLHEFVHKARANLNQNAWDYIVGAAETETTMRRNRMSLDEIAFRPRVLRN